MAAEGGAPPAQEAVEGAPAAAPPAEGQAADGAALAKPPRGKPKDPHAPPKPKNAYQRVTGVARARLKEQRPELATDLKAMGLALKEEWDKVPQEEKDKMTTEFEKEMEIWRPKWAAYKQTKHYKEFFERKQDWVDARQIKKLKKKAAKEAPTRPKSGYMIFGSEIRERVCEEVKAAGGGMGDIGKKISEEWAALSEAKKAEYAERSAKMKEKWIGEYTVYKKSDAYKKLVADQATMLSKQKQKKLMRVKLDEAPKKPPSAMALFRAEMQPKVMAEHKGKSMGELSKIYGELWSKVPDDEKAKYAKEAEKLKKEYEEKKDAFKTKNTYIEFLEQRRDAKMKENKTVKLIDLPKRPKSVFAMFADLHKNEVPQGKGEGKGRSALKVKFETASAEEKEALKRKEEEGLAKFKQELQEFKESETFKGYLSTEKKIKLEFMNEAMKVMTLKFLKHSPPSPPKSAFAVYVGEKRKADADADGAPKSKKEKAEEVNVFRKQFMALDRATKKEYDNTRLEKHKAWQAEVKEYMEKPMWQDYLKEAKRMKVPIKSLLADKKNVAKKLKNGMRFVPMPEKPPDFPQKPKGAYSLFCAAKKGSMELSEMPQAWEKLEAEEKQKILDEAASLQKEYDTNMTLFKQSDEGKAYFREAQTCQRRRRVNLAKVKYLKDQPKKPLDPKMAWMKANLPKVKQEFPDLKGHELKMKLIEKLKNLPDEEREKMEEESKKKQEEFSLSMKEFKESENYQKYCKMAKAKAKGKAAPSVPVPEDMPRKPPDALRVFRKEQSGKPLAEVVKMFNELEQEEKEKRNAEANEAMKKYEADLAAWEKTDIGKKYKKQVASQKKALALASAKSRFLKDEPKKPAGALHLWMSENRAAIQRDNPELKGLGPLMAKMHSMFRDLSDEDKQVWLDKEKQAREEYQQKHDEWKKSPDGKKYTAIINRLSGGGKGGGKGKGKAKAKAKGVPMPEKPEGLPKKPPSGFFIFMQEKSGAGVNKAQINKDWIELGAEGQKKYNDDSKARMDQYEKDMKVFMKTAEGKKYNRLKQSADKQQRIAAAKKKFLSGDDLPAAPKRPASAYFIFANETRPTLGSIGLKEMSQKITALWNELTPEDKKKFEDRAATAKEEYEKAMQEYNNNPKVQAFHKAEQRIKKAKPKPKAKPVKPAKAAKAEKKAGGGRGRGRGGGRGRGAAAPAAGKAASNDSDSDVMGSDSDSSSDDSDSD